MSLFDSFLVENKDLIKQFLMVFILAILCSIFAFVAYNKGSALGLGISISLVICTIIFSIGTLVTGSELINKFDKHKSVRNIHEKR